MRTEIRLVGCISRVDRVSGYMGDVLHWLPYPQRIVYHVCALVQHCIEGLAPPCLRELCCPTAAIPLRSFAQLVLIRRSPVIRQCHSFSVADPTAWKVGLRVALRLTPLGYSALFLLESADRGVC